jgi:hypothetical protein
VSFFSGRGVPNDLQAEFDKTMPIQVQLLPSTSDAVKCYEEKGVTSHTRQSLVHPPRN